MSIEYTNYSIKNIYRKNESNKLVLPNFQRGFIWDIDNTQKKLVSSFLVGVPIGSLLLLQGNNNDFAARDLCVKETVLPEKECMYVLDGQQRLSTLKSVIHDIFQEFNEENDPYGTLYKRLQNRWFLRIEPNEKEVDVFGFRYFTDPKLNKIEPDELFDFIYPYKIYKKYQDEWYHPYKRYDGEGKYAIKTNQGRKKFADESAKYKLVPLFELNIKDYGIHRSVLERIAADHAKELRAKVQDGIEDAKNVFYEHGRNEDEIDHLLQDESFWQSLIYSWVNKVAPALESLVDNKIPVIELPQEEINRAVAIFEQLNEGGTPLNIFDLIVAKAARVEVGEASLSNKICENILNGISLPEWTNKNYTWTSEGMGTIDDNFPSKHFQDFFLNNISLLVYSHYGIKKIRVDYIKKTGILNLTSSNITENYSFSTEAVNRALFFLQNRCGVFNTAGLSYKLMLQPIAFIFSYDSFWYDYKVHNLLEYWYWISLFGGSYREKQNEKCIDDLISLYYLIQNKNYDQFISKLHSREDLVFNHQNYSDSNTLLNLNEDVIPPKSLSLGILQYVLRKKPVDILDNNIVLDPEDISNDKIDVEIHHIIPLYEASSVDLSAKELRKSYYKQHVLNSPFNMCYVSKQTNAKLKNYSPHHYLKNVKLQKLASLFLPNNKELEIKDSESYEDYYFRIINARFKYIQSDLFNHLQSLKKDARLE